MVIKSILSHLAACGIVTHAVQQHGIVSVVAAIGIRAQRGQHPVCSIAITMGRGGVLDVGAEVEQGPWCVHPRRKSPVTGS